MLGNCESYFWYFLCVWLVFYCVCCYGVEDEVLKGEKGDNGWYD